MEEVPTTSTTPPPASSAAGASPSGDPAGSTVAPASPSHKSLPNSHSHHQQQTATSTPKAKARKTLLIVTGLGFLISLLALAAVLAAIFTPANVNASLVPTFSFYIFIGLAGVSTLLSGIGFIALIRRRRSLLYIFLLFLVLLLMLDLVTGLVLLTGYFQVYSSSLYDISAAGLTSSIAAQITAFAFANPAAWVLTQNRLKCCGYDFREGFVLTAPVNVIQQYAGNLLKADVVSANGGNAFPAYADALHSGSSCTAEGMQEVQALMTAAPHGMYDSSAQAIYDTRASVTSPSSGFYCRDALLAMGRSYYIYIAVGTGLLFLVEIVSIFCTLDLLYFVQKKRGGFAMDKEEPSSDVDDDEEQIG